ncbi:hypothetical protein Y032_0267g743 [Ancylostoma ceylanicum]|nr:hypothetical protein Y032_0267g743 [Ancylostoma ceylanicum]
MQDILRFSGKVPTLPRTFSHVLNIGDHLVSHVDDISRFLISSPFQQCAVKVTEVTKTLFLIGSRYPLFGAGADPLQESGTWCWLAAWQQRRVNTFRLVRSMRSTVVHVFARKCVLANWYKPRHGKRV